MRTRSHLPSLAVVASAVALLAGCGPAGATGNDDGPAGGDSGSEAATGDHEVTVVDNAFEPGDLEVVAGEAVAWVFEGNAPHDVVGDDFDSDVQRDGTFTHTFEDPGVHDYECTLHPGMDGRITVVDG